ncbi:hypothetical protein T08_14639 [Trichinella sp. T8]|nr:hypothetical protein T08_14639 [Trichinella sp. T8]
MDTLESFYNYGRKWRVAHTTARICCRVAEYFCSGCDNDRLADAITAGRPLSFGCERTALRASTLASTSNRTVRRSDAASTSSRRRRGCGGKWRPIEGGGRRLLLTRVHVPGTLLLTLSTSLVGDRVSRAPSKRTVLRSMSQDGIGEGAEPKKRCSVTVGMSGTQATLAFALASALENLSNVGNILAAGQMSSIPTDKAAMEKAAAESVAPVDQWNEVSTHAKEDSGYHGAAKTKVVKENGAEMEVDEKGLAPVVWWTEGRQARSTRSRWSSQSSGWPMDTLESFYNYGRKWRVAHTTARICCRVAEYFCSGCDNDRLADAITAGRPLSFGCERTALRASTLASTSNRTVRRSDAASTSSRRRRGCGGKWRPIEGGGRRLLLTRVHVPGTLLLTLSTSLVGDRVSRAPSKRKALRSMSQDGIGEGAEPKKRCSVTVGMSGTQATLAFALASALENLSNVGNILAAGQMSSIPTDKAAMEKAAAESVAPVDQWNEVSTHAKEDSGYHGAAKTKVVKENGAEMEVDEKVVEKKNRHRFVTARFQHYHHHQ